jgi:hypothetical protein
MWQVAIVCSSCAEEVDVVVDDLDDLDHEVCDCGYGFVVLAVAGFEPVHAAKGDLIDLPRRRSLSLAA